MAPCLTMGVVNVTPDSFVGEIRTPGLVESVKRCHQLVDQGADLLDIGGESTRPGATPISVEQELERVIPVIEAIAPDLPVSVRISVDTRHETVARAAVSAGAQMINDMSASLGPIAAELGVDYVAAHMQGTPPTMQDNPTYGQVVDEVLDAMVDVATRTLDAGAPAVWIDPGIGFGKSDQHNLELLANIDRFVATGLPVLIGVSRKGLIGRLHTLSDAPTGLNQRLSNELSAVGPTPTDDRLEGSIAMAVWCALLGVNIVRVHDVSGTVHAMKVVQARQTV